MPYSFWTESEVQFLRENYERIPASDITVHLKRSRHSIYGKARLLGLKARMVSIPLLTYLNKYLLSKLCVLLLTDGCISGDVMQFTNCSLTLHRIFSNLIETLFSIRRYHRSERTFKGRRTVYRTMLGNKAIVEYLKTFTPTYRHRPFANGIFPTAKIPDIVFELRKRELGKVLKLAFDCDGFVSETKSGLAVFLACKHPTLRRGYSVLLNKLGINVSEYVSGIGVFGSDDLNKFVRGISFTKGVKIGLNSRQFQGFDKREILKRWFDNFSQKQRQKPKGISFFSEYLGLRFSSADYSVGDDSIG